MKDHKVRIIPITLILCICISLCFVAPMQVYGADGVLSIAVSSMEVSVGSNLTVTLHAEGSGGETATADMEFTYDTSVFSFVSCDAYYSGGEGGKVNASGSTVTITLKAIASGSAGLKVSGSNGKLADSQESLSSMVPAGVTITAGGGEDNANKSGDNSLSSLTLSAGELSPAFAYNVTEYTAEVPYDVTSIDVNAKTSNSGAKVEDIIGNRELQVGENRIAITVKAENGARVVYNIIVTRREEGAGSPGGEDASQDPGDAEHPDASQGSEDPGEPENDAKTPDNAKDNTEKTDETVGQEEYEQRIAALQQGMTQLEDKYKAEKSFSRKMIAILGFISVILVILCINLLVFMKRKRSDAIDWEETELPEKKTRKKKGHLSDAYLGQEDDWLDDEIISEPLPKKTGRVIKEEKEIPKTPEAPKETYRNPEEIEFIDLDDL